LTLFSTKGKERAAVERAADTFPILGQRLKQSAGSLSGGEQQMLAMTRAYLSNPQLVLVDEASMGLAPKIVDHIFEFMATIVSQGASLLIVEQYIYRALRMADRVYLLNHGGIVFSGSPAELQRDNLFERYLGVEAGLSA
jgi:branched-chain amino acid transport system ATP-binding protein